MSRAAIRIGTRGSALALAQARLVADALEREGRATRLVIVETEGDRRAPDTAWGEGAFVAAIERVLLAGRVDIAVHSAKDVPTDEDRRLVIGAYLERADPRDALVARDGVPSQLDALPPGSRIGTDSPRRMGFLLARRSDLEVHPLHGNVDTRLRRLDAGETDALVLASAGLDRLGLELRIGERLDPEIMPPAPGQGAVAVQIRRDDARLAALARTIDHAPTRGAVETERMFLAACGGGCRSPIGAIATADDGELELLGGWASPDGSWATTDRRRGPRGAGAALARELAAELGSRAGSSPRGAAVNTEVASPRRVLVTRAAEQADALVSALRDAGAEPLRVPAIAVDFEPAGGELDAAARQLDTYAWVVCTSANGARAIVESAKRVGALLAGPRWAAVGPGTRLTLEQAGIQTGHEPGHSSSAAIGTTLPLGGGDRILVVRGDLAGDALARALRARGAVVDDVIAYRTREAPQSSRPLLQRAFADGPIDAVVFTSGSTVHGLVALAQATALDVVSVPAICIGPETAESAKASGFSVLAVSPVPQAVVLAETTLRALADTERRSN